MIESNFCMINVLHCLNYNLSLLYTRDEYKICCRNVCIFWDQLFDTIVCILTKLIIFTVDEQVLLYKKNKYYDTHSIGSVVQNEDINNWEISSDACFFQIYTEYP